MGKMAKESYRIQIIVALIGVAGIFSAAVILNWDKIFKEPVIPPPEPQVEPDREPERLEVIEEELVEAALPPKPCDVVTNSIGMKLVFIPAGSFMMGNREQHQVSISEGFRMGQTEVTQGQYKSVMNAQPWSGKLGVQESDNNPAVCVSWEDAVAFCDKLSVREGKTYRLPTEAEWEYACRAGTTTRFSFGDSDSSLGDYAWFFDNTRKVRQGYAHPVGQKKPNPWGLYDMHGNCWEWCNDKLDGEYGPVSAAYRSLRGGSWINAPLNLDSSFHLWIDPICRYAHVGFRVVRSQP